MNFAFSPWQQRAYEQACEAIDAGRLAHGMLFCGPANLGKRAVAERLAQRMLCQARGTDGEACGQCRSCLLLAAGTHPDFNLITFVPNREGTRLRTEIVIEQIRGLSEKLMLTPQYGGAQVAIIDPADAINHAACNALLKTLEEPVPGRYLWLVSAHPARLPATIRSRCQKLEFRLPSQDEAIAWLGRQGHPGPAAAEALAAARGHPGLADLWLRDGVLKLRRDVADDLSRLRRGETAALETAQRWTADEHAVLRLGFAADLALAEATGLTDPGRTRSLAAWFDAANRMRDLLRTTVRADLAVADLLLAWRGHDARAMGGGK
ncbi:DNA polymerase-3 subunit delta' [Luteimonas cucumeris]|uniref:DNA-directed DNA polymerase n=1 Tax=Luteimonas cucumeris TaxID=985012 RepID=A0A562L7R4_9GAMM|nr:DNA polymerase III subunit delta' [Luteimonas cucumeris]TWI03494.1 DNA polymerase-3 subunit delta' [Luteimonas cucumeris]